MSRRISIITPVGLDRRVFDLVDSLRSLHGFKEVEFLISVNGPGSRSFFDEVCRYVSNLDNAQVLYTAKLGAAYARNLAVRQATGQYLLFLDADQIVRDPRTLLVLLEAGEELRLAHIPQSFVPEGGSGRLATALCDLRNGWYGMEAGKRVATPASSFYMPCLVMERSLYLRVGGLRPLATDDTDFDNRVSIQPRCHYFDDLEPALHRNHETLLGNLRSWVKYGYSEGLKNIEGLLTWNLKNFSYEARLMSRSITVMRKGLLHVVAVGGFVVIIAVTIPIGMLVGLGQFLRSGWVIPPRADSADLDC